MRFNFLTLELIPKNELPDWGPEDEKLKLEFEDRLRKGHLHLVSARCPELD